VSSPNLIDDLANDLTPVEPPRGVAPSTLRWLLLGWTAVLLATIASGSFRPGVGEQLASTPRFVLECLVGWVVGASAIWAALSSGIPGNGSTSKRGRAVVLLAASWAAMVAAGLVWPLFPDSMAGKRHLCHMETILFAVPPLILGLAMMRKRLTLEPRWTGFLMGLAAGSIPALIMQWACMYDPLHVLQLHLAPALLVAVVGWVIAPRFLPRI